MGYDDESKTYRLYDNLHRKFILSRDVIFDEKLVGAQYLDQVESGEPLFHTTPAIGSRRAIAFTDGTNCKNNIRPTGRG